MTLRRTTFWFVIVAICVAGGWFVFAPKTISVETAVARKERFIATVTEDGRARVRDRFTISAPLAGRLSRISLRAGDTIKAKQTIAVIHPSLPPLIDPRTRHELEARVGAAEANVAEAKSWPGKTGSHS